MVTRWVKFVEMCDTRQEEHMILLVRMIAGLSENSMLRDTFYHPIYYSWQYFQFDHK